MKTFDEILDNFAFEHNYENWDDMFYACGVEIGTKGIETIAKRYAIEVAKQALINASENVQIEHVRELNYDEYYEVDKNSILSESNIPTLS